MDRNRNSRAIIRWLGVLTVILTLASAASASWKEKVLCSFQGGTDGAVPAGGVVFDKQGNLYGVTSDGGGVYQLAPPVKQGGKWTESVLYVFQGNTKGDGATPEGGLVIDSAGNLYGTTAYGGTGNCVLLGILVGCGTVYELSPPAQKGGPWTETVLYSFPTAKQGYFPVGDLAFDGAGNLYGATFFGGGKGTTCDPAYQYCGAVFELNPPKTKGGKWTEKVLYGFKGVPAGAQFGDGANPNGGLVLDSKGAIYGTTYYGGNNVKGECQGGTSGTGCGIVFKVTPPSQKGKWTEKILHQFDGKDGANSAAGVVFDGNGKLYGTLSAGATNGNGAVFDLVAPTGGHGTWKEAVLYRFSGGNDGASPTASPVFDARGSLYGTTNVATSQSARGNVFRLKPPFQKGGDWAFGVIYTFKVIPDGERPGSNLVFDKNGNLYGTTQEGGTGTACTFGCGTVFEVSP
jgi:hypothetical protein